ncbi:hypothetical protein ACFLV8_02265 [Chloroflexota bacterium]
MKTKTLTFRLPTGWPAHLKQVAHTHNFNSCNEMLGLALTECTFNTMAGKLKLKGGSIAVPTWVVGCRLPEATHRAIVEHCCKQVKDTPSVWAALAVVKWVEELKKQDNREEKQGMYWIYLQNYAATYRPRIASLQYEIDRIMEQKAGNN